ncbi:MAG: RNA methyltransferase [Arsenicicoccus sp.]|nr:MAG: RNA methyltransferase [Arsenicicoccus sp.]
MAYDEGLAQRIRDLLAGETGVVEKRMFGGLAFLVGGHMAVAAGLEPMVMRGRPMREWVHSEGAAADDEDLLAELVRLGVERARAQPPKT